MSEAREMDPIALRVVLEVLKDKKRIGWYNSIPGDKVSLDYRFTYDGKTLLCNDVEEIESDLSGVFDYMSTIEIKVHRSDSVYSMDSELIRAQFSPVWYAVAGNDEDAPGRETEVLPRRLLISDVDLESGDSIPEGYRRAYRIPGTCTALYCKRPLSYILRALEWTWRRAWGIFFWIPKHVLYKGEFRD